MENLLKEMKFDAEKAPLGIFISFLFNQSIILTKKTKKKES
jgi:hypothetical protein